MRISKAQKEIEGKILKDARELGKLSYSKGESRIPALNPSYFEMVKANPLPIGKLGNDRIEAFVNGWVSAMLAEPIPGMEEFYNSRPKVD